MGYYRTDQIYERLNSIQSARQTLDGSNSFGQVSADAEEQLVRLGEEEIRLLAELDDIRAKRDWCRPAIKITRGCV